MKRKQKKNFKKDPTAEFRKSVRGEERKQFFEEDKPLSLWRGVSSIHKPKREKRTSRSKNLKKSIEDSE